MRTLLFLLLCSGFETEAQELLPVKQNEKWGYIDRTGNMKITPRYEQAESFEKRPFALIAKQGRFGMINKKGVEVVAPQYDAMYFLSPSLVATKDHEKWGVIDTTGKVLLTGAYDDLTWLRKRIIAVKEGTYWGLMDLASQRQIAPIMFDKITNMSSFFELEINHQLGLVDSTGTEILATTCEEIDVFSPQLILFKRQEHWGIINKNGNEIIAPEYMMYSKSTGARYIELKRDSFWNLFSSTSEKIITPETYSSFRLIAQGFIETHKYAHVGLIDSTGRVLLKPLYNGIENLGAGVFKYKQGKCWGLINKNGDTLLSPRYDGISDFSGETALLYNDKCMGLIDVNGKILLQPDFDKISLYNNIAKIKNGNQLLVYHYDATQGKLEEETYSNVRTLKIGSRGCYLKKKIMVNDSLADNGWFYSEEKNKWGLKNPVTGVVRIPPIFDQVKLLYKDGLTMVGKKCQNITLTYGSLKMHCSMLIGLVDNNTGHIICEPRFVLFRVGDFANADLAYGIDFRGHTALVYKNGFIKTLGEGGYLGNFVNGIATYTVDGKLEAEYGDSAECLVSVDKFIKEMNVFGNVTFSEGSRWVPNKGLLLFCKGGHWGYIRSSGRILIKPTYDFARASYKGSFIVKQGDMYGLLDEQENPILNFMYTNINYLPNSDNSLFLIEQKNGKYSYVSDKGRIISDLKFKKVGTFSDGKALFNLHNKWGYIDENGKEVVRDTFARAHDFNEQLASICIKGKWGFVDNDGDLQIAPMYKQAGNFHDGLAWVALDEKVGYINEENNIIIPAKFQQAFDFDNGTARVKKHDKIGLIDEKGKWVKRPTFTAISTYDENDLAVVKKHDRCGLIDRSGQLIARCKYDKIGPFSEGLAWVLHNGKYGYIDERGKEVIKLAYAHAGDFSEGLARVKIKSKWGYIDAGGDTVIPPKYSKCLDFKEGIAGVYEDEKAYYINKNGERILDEQVSFKEVNNFSENIALVKDYTGYKYITQEGKCLSTQNYAAGTNFHDGLAKVKINNKWGLINQMGMPVLTNSYDKISDFKNGYASVYINKLVGIANSNGQVLLEPTYECIRPAGKGLYRVERVDRVGYYNKKGKWLWEMQR